MTQSRAANARTAIHRILTAIAVGNNSSDMGRKSK
jgi:hypothetical protein